MSEISKKSEKNEEEELIEYPEDNECSEFEFLKELTKDHYVEKKELTEKELKKIKNEEKRQLHIFIQEQQREEKRQIRMNREEDLRQKREMNVLKIKDDCIKEKNEKEDNNSLFDENPTILMGRDRLLITKKIQYKILFPKELSKFKLKKKQLWMNYRVHWMNASH